MFDESETGQFNQERLHQGSSARHQRDMRAEASEWRDIRLKTYFYLSVKKCRPIYWQYLQ